MPLPDPDHDLPHLSPARGQSVDSVDQLGTPVLLGLAAVGAIAVTAISLAIG